MCVTSTVILLLTLALLVFYIFHETKEESKLSVDRLVTLNSIIHVITLTDTTECVIKLDDYYFQSDYTCNKPLLSKDLHTIWKSERFERRLQSLQDIIYLRTGIRVPIQYHSISDPIV